MGADIYGDNIQIWNQQKQHDYSQIWGASVTVRHLSVYLFIIMSQEAGSQNRNSFRNRMSQNPCVNIASPLPDVSQSGCF